MTSKEKLTQTNSRDKGSEDRSRPEKSTDDGKVRDDVLKRMLNTPHVPHKPKKNKEKQRNRRK